VDNIVDLLKGYTGRNVHTGGLGLPKYTNAYFSLGLPGGSSNDNFKLLNNTKYAEWN